jgi:pyrroline-5-carboxylate reductase
MIVNKTIGFIGGGRIVRIFLEGFKKEEVQFARVMVSDINPAVGQKQKNMFPYIEIFSDNNKVAAYSDIVFLAVHPPVLMDVLKNIGKSINSNSILVSLSPKITINKISEVLGGFKKIVRMIPDAPSIINEGYNPVVFSDSINQDEKDELLKLFSVLGKCPLVKEDILETYAVLTGMGPTYFWFQWKKLVDMGISFGMDEKEARNAIFNMIEGSVKTFFGSSLSFEEVMDLIPVRPLSEDEGKINEIYQSRIEGLYKKIKP